MKLYQYMQYQDFEEDWLCPYCKESSKKFIRVFEEEKNGIVKTSVIVTYGTKPMENHRNSCRNRRLMELANYHEQEFDGCFNCKEYNEPSIHDEISNSEGSCNKFDRYVRFRGICDEHERKKEI